MAVVCSRCASAVAAAMAVEEEEGEMAQVMGDGRGDSQRISIVSSREYSTKGNYPRSLKLSRPFVRE